VLLEHVNFELYLFLSAFNIHSLIFSIVLIMDGKVNSESDFDENSKEKPNQK